MTTYQQSSNNGICTANLSVEHFGWNQMSKATWYDVEPLGLALGNANWEITDYDKGPLIKGKMTLTIDDDVVLDQDFDKGHKHAYWTYDDVIKEYLSQIPYGEAKFFTLTVEDVVFRYITGRWTNGGTKTVKDVALDIRDTFVFRQRNDTGSYGSENERYLFWPWQQER